MKLNESEVMNHEVNFLFIAWIAQVVLFGISARLLGEGGALTKKCEDVVVLRWQWCSTRVWLGLPWASKGLAEAPL